MMVLEGPKQLCGFYEVWEMDEQPGKDFVSIVENFDTPLLMPKWFVQHKNLDNLHNRAEFYRVHSLKDVVCHYAAGKLYVRSAAEAGNSSAVAMILSTVLGHYGVTRFYILSCAYFPNSEAPGMYGGGMYVIGPCTYQYDDMTGKRLSEMVEELKSAIENPSVHVEQILNNSTDEVPVEEPVIETKSGTRIHKMP